MPVLHILGGPNGAGKTSFYKEAISENFIPRDLPFINVDLIAQSLGGYTETNYALAPEIYRDKIREYLNTKADFLIESNLADNKSYDWISRMKNAGYEIILYFLSTEDVEINISRVKRRVAEGGHDVPEAIIRTRYNQSHSYLKTKLREFSKVYLLDSSSDAAIVEATVWEGIISLENAESPDWVKDVLSVLTRLNEGRTR